jgi:hypothetical protein
MFNLLLAILICYRLSHLLTKEHGPFHVFSRLRAYSGRLAAKAQREAQVGEDEYTDASHTSPVVLVAEILSCPLCAGVWIALVLAVLFFGWQFLVYWLAIAGGQLALHKFGVIMSHLAEPETDPEE